MEKYFNILKQLDPVNGHLKKSGKLGSYNAISLRMPSRVATVGYSLSV